MTKKRTQFDSILDQNEGATSDALDIASEALTLARENQKTLNELKEKTKLLFDRLDSKINFLVQRNRLR